MDIPKPLQRENRRMGRRLCECARHRPLRRKPDAHSGQLRRNVRKAATDAEKYLRTAALELLPQFLDYYPAILWEDQDECLEVEPKDIDTWSKV
jgi:hypothetical protein